METPTKAPTSSAERTTRTPLGKKLLEMRQSMVASGRLLLDWEDIDREIAAQRGRQGKEDER